jgi:HlyD family secretion protein
MQLRHRSVLRIGLLLAVLTASLASACGRNKAPVYRTEPLQRGDVRVLVSATGTLNPVTTVQVGSQISGTIAALNADFNSRVKAGQILAQLDPTFLRAQVAQSEAEQERAVVAQRQAEREYARLTPLREEGLSSQAEIDAAESALEAAKATVKGADAALTRAETNLRYATIRSPIDGIVVSRNVDVGQTVAASLSAPTIFTIANDLTRMQLEAWVDEADIGRITVGQAVSFTVDAFPELTFDGLVEQIRLAPRTEQNVVSYTVIVRVDNPEQRLLPGMTANANFLIAEELDVWKAPMAALRALGAPGGAPGGAPNGAPGGGGRGGPGGPGGAGHPPGGPMMPPAAPGGAMAPPAGPGGPPPMASLNVLDDGGAPRRIHVTTGLSDGMFIAVASDSLREGMRVVVGIVGQANAENSGTVNPFMPGGGRRDRH